MHRARSAGQREFDVTAPETTEPATPADDFQLVDFEQLKNRVGYTLRAVGRRKLLFAVTFMIVAGLAGGVLAITPRTFHVDTQLLAQRNTMMPALGNPGRTVPLEADTPTRAAAEAVLRRDNLVSLIKQTDLMNQWALNRPAVLRFKDRLVALVDPPTEEDKLNAMIGFIEARLSVATRDSTVTISIDWPDAQLAYRLVETAQQNFLEQRHAQEVSSIAETISILEGHAATVRESLDAAMDDLRKTREVGPPKVGTGPAATAPANPRRDATLDARRAETAELRVLLEAKRRAINELEEFRRRRLAELQADLAQQKTVYASAHPVVLKLQQSINAMQEDSPQLIALRKEESALSEELAARMATARAEGSLARGPRPVDASPARRPGAPGEDVAGEYARTRVRFAMEKYDTLLERIDSARIELDTARAAFKYRYSVVRPPIFPKRPSKPKIPVFIAGSLLAALALGVAAAVLADLRSGRLLEPWQVERQLGLSILGELPRS